MKELFLLTLFVLVCFLLAQLLTKLDEYSYQQKITDYEFCMEVVKDKDYCIKKGK